MSKDKTPNNMGDFDAINEVVDEVTAENSLHNEGRIIQVELDHEMRKSFLEYSMSVIVDRALPDVRDGLKPVHRRILFAADEDGLTPDKPHRKSATIVGDVLGRYHPHGDASVYDAMVRLAQTFSLRYPLIDGHGNFGTIDGDPPAAYRYTEARLSKIALYMLSDIDKDTVDWNPNFDDQRKEPVVLPSRFPNLLCNGSVGIAVGMATNIPPHNLREVSDAVCYLIDHPEAELNELMQYIQGPDFPTGGIIMGRSGIRAAYATGRGKITLRSKTEIEEMKNGRERIIVREIPYMVNKARLIESIAQLVKDKRVDGISYINDESDREGMRIVIDLKMGANAQVVLNQLYSFTQLQDSIGVIMLALENGVPKRIQSSTIISARSLRDAVGLVYDVEEDTVLRTTVNGVYLPCEGTGSTEGGDVTAPGFERQTGSLYLFAGNAYTDLNDFTVDLSGLTAVDSGGNALDGTRWAIYAGDVIEADDYRYRLLTVETDQPRRLYISGTVTLRRNGVTYRLTLTNYPCGADPAP